ncbi:LacI family DNA-binding transcriptional regulator [Actinacidiphila alni]|uniref:LacI family DNA-binding transcriptional regulator n=1 Tax=Actinacidiphila alni TaxID=380248 RepID=UPI0034518CBA
MSSETAQRLTLRSIAAEVGVSVSTVSKVLNGRPGVGSATRDQVRRVVERHHYRRGGRLPGTTVVDLVLNEVDSLWSAEIITGVEDVLNAAGVTMTLTALHGTPTDTGKWLARPADRRADGAVLVVADLRPRQRLRLASLGLPVVLIDPAGSEDTGVPTVGTTNWAGAVAATEHLIGLGHRRIAHVAGPPGLLSSRARADGFRVAMERSGLPVPDGWTHAAVFNEAAGHAAAGRLFGTAHRPAPAVPTAVFAASDQQAFGVYRALRDRGLRVPEDVSVVGFDDVPATRWSDPGLTTVRQPLREMAATGARTLLRLIDGTATGPRRVDLATRLVVRHSTAAPGTSV